MPSPTLVAAAEAAPPLRLRQRRPFESVTLHLSVFRSLVLPPRDWAGLPSDLLSSILHRLDHIQMMLGADKVCRSWRRAARDEPELWRHIDMRGYDALYYQKLVDINEMAVEAVQRSQGQCQAFSGEGDGLHDEFIHYLGDHAPLLKRLILASCNNLSGQGFVQAIKGFPLLEELHISKCCYLQHVGVFEAIAKECPRLKHLTVCDAVSTPIIPYGYENIVADMEAMAIARMQGLRSLQLTHNNLSIQGLAAIIDNCIHLESLDLLNCYRIRMTPEMEARIKAKKLLMNYSSDGRFLHDFVAGFRPAPSSECSTCLNYFSCYQNLFLSDYPNDEKEAIVISAVRGLRYLELYHNDLTSNGLAAVLDKCPHLEPTDVWNCLNIVRNNHNALQGKWHWIKTKKVTTKLLMDRSKHSVFNPEGLDIRNCHNIVINSCHGRRIIMDNTLGAKYKRLKLRKMAKKYHERTKAMKAWIEEYIAIILPGANIDYMEFEGVSLDYGVLNPQRFELGSPISECSTCLMIEYFAERWGVLDLDDYADYYDSSYGLDRHDETEFQVHDRMLVKRFRRYLKME